MEYLVILVVILVVLLLLVGSKKKDSEGKLLNPQDHLYTNTFILTPCLNAVKASEPFRLERDSKDWFKIKI